MLWVGVRLLSLANLKSTESDLGYADVLPIEREPHMTIPPARLWSHVQEEETLRRCHQSLAAAKKTGLGQIVDSRKHASTNLIECGSSFSIARSMTSDHEGCSSCKAVATSSLSSPYAAIVAASACQKYAKATARVAALMNGRSVRRAAGAVTTNISGNWHRLARYKCSGLAEGADRLLDRLLLGEVRHRREQRGALPHFVDELSRHAGSVVASQDARDARESFREREHSSELRLRPELAVVGSPVGQAHAKLLDTQRRGALSGRTNCVRRSDETGSSGRDDGGDEPREPFLQHVGPRRLRKQPPEEHDPVRQTLLRAEGIAPPCRCYGRSDRGQYGEAFPVSARPPRCKVASTQRHERLDDHRSVIRIAPALHFGPRPTHPLERIVERARSHCGLLPCSVR